MPDKRLTDREVYDRLHECFLRLGETPAQTDLGYETLKRGVYFLEALQRAHLEMMEKATETPRSPGER